MKKLTELLSDTLVYGISSVAARFVTYLLVPFYTDVFLPAEYGIIGLIYSAIAVLNVIFTFGMESAYLRYAAERDKARSVFKTLQLALLTVASALAMLLWLSSPVIMPYLGLTPQTADLFYYMIAILWLDTLAIVPFAELRLVRKSYLFAAVRLTNVCINLALNFYLILWLNFGLEAVLISQLAASGSTAIFLWAYTASMFQSSFNPAHLMRALRFGLPFIPAGIGYTINEFIDRFFLNAMTIDEVEAIYGAGMTPEAVTGIYNACYKLAVFMLLIVQMFRMAWQPFFMRHAEGDDAKDLFRQVFRVFNVVAAGAFLAVALFSREIASIPVPVLQTTIIDEAYWQGLSIVPFILLAYWFQGWYVNFTAGIFIKEETGYLPKVTLLGAAITLIGNSILVSSLGMMGSAIATLLSYSTMAVVLFYISKRIYPVNYEMVRAVLTIGIAAGTYVWCVWIMTGSNLSLDFSSKVIYTIAALFLIGAINLPGLLKSLRK